MDDCDDVWIKKNILFLFNIYFLTFNFRRLRVRLSGNILFDWLLNPFISVFMRIFDNVIMKFVELTIRNVAQVAIASINSNIKEVIQRIEALN